MNIKLGDIAKQPVIQNRKESEEFLRWIDSLDSISVQYIPRGMYEDKHNKGEDILEAYVQNSNDLKPAEYRLYIPYDFAYGDIVYLVDLITKKIGTKEYFTNNWLASRLKTQLVHIFGKNGISVEEIKNLQQTYHISDETVDKIMKAPIGLNELKSISNKEEKIESLKSSARIGLDAVMLDKGKQTLGDFMMTFTKDDYNSISAGAKDFAKQKYGVKSDEEVKNYLNQTEENLWRMIEKKYKELESLGDQNIQKNILIIIANEVQKFPWQEGNIDKLTDILHNKNTQCLMQCFLSHVLLSRLGIKHTTFSTKEHIQLIVYVGDEMLLLDTTSNIPLEQIYEKGNSNVYPHATKISTGYDFNWGYKARNFSTGYEKEVNIGLLSALYYNKASYSKNSRFYDCAIELNPYDRYLYLGRSLFYLKADNLEKSKNDLEKYVSFIPKEIHSDKDIIYMYKSLAGKYMELQQFEQALELCKTILEIDSGDELALNWIKLYNHIKKV